MTIAIFLKNSVELEGTIYGTSQNALVSIQPHTI